MKIAGTHLLKSAYIQNCLNPVWDEKFNVPVCHQAKDIEFKVKDREHVGSATVGFFKIRAEDVIGGEEKDGWYDLNVGGGGETQGEVHIKIQFFPIGEHVDKVLADAYFEPTSGNKVTLYQDAVTPQLPIFDGILNPDGNPYKTTNW